MDDASNHFCVNCTWSWWDKPGVHCNEGRCPNCGSNNVRVKTTESGIKAPPLALKPRYIHDEQRMNDIKEAIKRYAEADLPINPEWIQEYNEMTKCIAIKRQNTIDVDALAPGGWVKNFMRVR